jgi:hypothetical protein
MQFLPIILLFGCASVFDAPAEPLIPVQPIQYRPHWDKTPVICEYVRDPCMLVAVPRNRKGV